MVEEEVFVMLEPQLTRLGRCGGVDKLWFSERDRDGGLDNNTIGSELGEARIFCAEREHGLCELDRTDNQTART